MPKKNDICGAITDFVGYANCYLFLKQEDSLFAFNRIASLLQITDCKYNGLCDNDFKLTRPDEVLKPLTDFALSKKIIAPDEVEYFENELMAVVIPPPSFFNEMFDELACTEGVKEALSFFYNFCIKSNYIKSRDLNENINWKTKGSKGDIIITVNAARKGATALKSTAYPKCVLCKENIGYGVNKQNPRQTLRYINFFLGGEQWFLQYSPLTYFNEHCNIICSEHRPMAITAQSFEKMIEFLNIAPHYFIGLNSELPLVGASNPYHDHFQAGRAELPLSNAAIKQRLSHPNYPKARITIPDWYTTVVRIESSDEQTICALAADIFSVWQGFSDTKAGISAKTAQAMHNSLSPLAYKNADNNYIIDLVLRNNKTDQSRPLGIFGIPKELTCIKNSPLGIMEVAGLFVLGGQLATDMQQIREYLTGETKLDFKALSDEKHPMSLYLPMIAQLINDCGTNCDEQKAAAEIERFVNRACERMLSCAAVFQNTPDGEKAFTKFIKACGLTSLS